MHSKISLKWPLAFISIVGIIFSSMVILFLTLGLPGQDSYTKPASPQASLGGLALPSGIQTPQNLTGGTTAEAAEGSILGEQTSLPTEQAGSGFGIRLKIPKINVDAAVESVGLTSDGAMDAPKNPVNVAWYNLGPRPGENGSAVIDGHFGWWKNGTPAVFNNLDKLQKGDKLYVEDEKGAITAFVVRESRKFNPDADASDVFVSNDGKAHLNLITCEGVWDKTQKSYSNRLIVFTDKEIE